MKEHDFIASTDLFNNGVTFTIDDPNNPWAHKYDFAIEAGNGVAADAPFDVWYTRVTGGPTQYARVYGVNVPALGYVRFGQPYADDPSKDHNHPQGEKPPVQFQFLQTDGSYLDAIYPTGSNYVYHVLRKTP
jgi:hypothetical protein